MKVKELIEQIKDYPDFELGISVINDEYGGFDKYSICGILDIGHSSKIIRLDVVDN
jgi:hypothetical protein